MKTAWIMLLIATVGMETLSAQSTVGALEGRIYEGESIPIASVNVGVSGPSLQGTRGTLTGSNGRFWLAALPVGEYTITITHIAFKSVRLEHIKVELGKTTSIGAIQLIHQTVIMPDMTTMAAPLLIDPTKAENSLNLPGNTIEQLPIERNYRSAVALLPQMNASYLGDGVNMAGATGLENKYIIDGMDVTDPFRNVSGTNLPYNFVQEIEVKSGGYAAEYRSSLGGIVNVITYSGGNQVHGQLYGFFSNNRFAAEPRQPMTRPAKGDFGQYDMGMRLGGPIVVDKLWFSLAYNPIAENEQVRIPGLGFYQDHSITHSFAAKMTWQAGGQNNLVLTVFGDPQKRKGVGDTFGTFGTPAGFVNPDPYLEDIHRGGINVSLVGHHSISDRILLETNASRLSCQEKNVPATSRGWTESLFIDASGQWSGGVPSKSINKSVVSSFGFKASFLHGRHSIKTGMEYRENRLAFGGNGKMVMQTGESNYFVWENLISDLSAHKIVRNRLPGAFIQDAWQIADRLHFSAGLRWDGQYLYSSSGELAQTINDEFQPRFGVTYQPGKLNRQKLYFSYGRFYQELNTWLFLGYLNPGAKTSFLYYSTDPRQGNISPDNGFETVTSSRPELQHLEGQYYDAYTLGYEYQLSSQITIAAHGSFHTLLQGIEDGSDPVTGDWWFDNPGQGVLKQYPAMKREYKAVQLKAEKPFDGQTGFLISYVWSKTFGNYPGLFNSDYNYAFPNTNGSYDLLETMVNATGLLPNDRTHVFKFFGSCRIIKNLCAGASVLWQTGTPLSELGGSEMGPPYNRFIGDRGSRGRTPTLFDFNLRLAYAFNNLAGLDMKPRLILDLFHIASRRTPVNFEQIHYYNLDENGNNINPNPLYGLASRFQPPMTMRLGMEVNF
jgi:hypothetical protein